MIALKSNLRTSEPVQTLAKQLGDIASNYKNPLISHGLVGNSLNPAKSLEIPDYEVHRVLFTDPTNLLTFQKNLHNFFVGLSW